MGDLLSPSTFKPSESLPTSESSLILATVHAKDPTQAEFRKAVARFGNPYRFVELDEDGFNPQPPTLEQQRAYLRKLEDPYAFHGIFDFEDGQAQPTCAQSTPADKTVPTTRLRASLDEVLNAYKPYIARSEWKKVTDYRPEFLFEAQRDPARAALILHKLEQLKFSLMPGEKVEFNRAPAERIVSQLKKLLR
ncbi:MAG TPA: hypothetical protein VN578_00760 [Candidatus Binatia bacterium]|jgi:hypothetical protein|nr:hypothetical protein [Candidatus Binatia bacterium]